MAPLTWRFARQEKARRRFSVVSVRVSARGQRISGFAFRQVDSPNKEFPPLSQQPGYVINLAFRFSAAVPLGTWLGVGQIIMRNATTHIVIVGHFPRLLRTSGVSSRSPPSLIS